MITGVHAMFYTSEPEATRAFLRDKLDLPSTDVGDGWLIFDAPAGDIGCHPSDREYHSISFECDDIKATVTELKSRGVEFTTDIEEAGFGWITSFSLPGGGSVELYQAKYTKNT